MKISHHSRGGRGQIDERGDCEGGREEEGNGGKRNPFEVAGQKRSKAASGRRAALLI